MHLLWCCIFCTTAPPFAPSACSTLSWEERKERKTKMQQQETNETWKEETETGHKGPVKKIYKTQNQVGKRHTHKVQAGTTWLKGKEKEKRHQPQPHPRFVFLETTLFNRWKMNFKSTRFGNGRGFSPSQALKTHFLFIPPAAELGLPPEGRQPFLTVVASLCSLLCRGGSTRSNVQSEHPRAKRQQDLWDFFRLTQESALGGRRHHPALGRWTSRWKWAPASPSSKHEVELHKRRANKAIKPLRVRQDANN